MAALTADHVRNRSAIGAWRAALYDFDAEQVAAAGRALFAPDASVHLAHPFEDLDGVDGLLGDAVAPLAHALPDLERRDWLVIAGDDPEGDAWVGCGGYYTGTFARPFLGIPPIGHQVSMRFHEYYRFDGGRVVEMQALWDIPELMMQAGAWPMGPSLGREWLVPGPATMDGIRTGPRDADVSDASRDHVIGMLGDMGRHPSEPVDAMRLEHWWHPNFSWYGPAGIGTSRGISGFRHWHQIPFLAAMPDRRGGYKGESHFFADGPYVGVTAWPGMAMTITGDGWLGIAPADQPIDGRSLDFWRVETQADGSLKIRENWVLVDLLHVWHQVGVDVLARMREMTSAGRIAREAFE